MAIILGLILIFRGGILFSPGQLSAAGEEGQFIDGFRSHADFEEECSRCHEPWRGVKIERCESCHTAVAENRRTNSSLHGHLPGAASCQECHTDHKGRLSSMTTFNLQEFEHSLVTEFSLKLHLVNYNGDAFSCIDCHGSDQFDRHLIDCQSCHIDHDSELMVYHVALYGDDCLGCHDGIDSMIGFDHDTIFTLDGAHADLQCGSCHETPIISGTPNECVGCHEEPEIHKGLFGLDCVRCHTSVAWLPAMLSQHTFPIDHGGGGKVECQVCHSVSYTVYNCFGCHEHEVEEVLEEHLEEGIAADEIDNCISCHPTGLEEE